MTRLSEIEADLDVATTRLLVPLRSDKTLNGAAMDDLLASGSALISEVSNLSAVPVPLVGKCWFIFTAMLAEADHASQPEPILDAAWQWADVLRRAFGPHFD